MGLVASMLNTRTLLNGLLGRDPGTLTISELDKLQQYVNQGRSLVLLKEHPQLESIFGTHALEDREEVVDILLCYVEEGGKIGSEGFRKLVDGMIERGHVAASITEALQRNRFLLPAPLANTNLDGVPV